jgi:hypothetical protein
MAGFGLLFFFPGTADKLAQALRTYVRTALQNFFEETVVSGNQCIAPSLDSLKRAHVQILGLVHLFERLPERLRIDLPHQSADVLHMSTLGTMLFNGFGKEECLKEALRHLEFFEFIP